jgi:phosphoglycolate phosphatase
MSAPRNLLMFDLDGTLIDSRHDLATAVNLTRRDYGLPPLPVERVAGYVGDGIEKLVERSLAGTAADLREATRRCAAHYGAHLHDRTVLYPGVARGLERLRGAGYRIALISNKPAAACRAILKHFGIAPFFDCVLGAGDTAHLKPDPDPLLEAIRRMEARPGTAWMVGDHRTDLEAARRAGVSSVWLACGIGERGAESPDLEFADFDVMTSYFLALRNA